MKRVYLSSSTNSQMFTECCRVAICEGEAFCPRCREEVYPGQDHTNHQRSMMRWSMAYGPTRRAMAARKAGAL